MRNSFSDTPTLTDEFDIESYIRGLSNFIRNCETPLTLAIQGDWGTGKTSIMYQVKERLEQKAPGKAKVKTIFFNTWQYSQFDMGNDLAVSLITDLISELEVSDSQKTEFFKTARSVLLKGLGCINFDFGILNGEKITEALAYLTSDIQERNKDIKRLKDNLQEIINQAIVDNKDDNNLNKKYEKIVIFIDDLDRLAPEKAVELLEVLKLFLDCTHCVFVLAIDYNVVIRGIKSKYGEDLDNEKGKAFFEKIIQVFS